MISLLWTMSKYRRSVIVRGDERRCQTGRRVLRLGRSALAALALLNASLTFVNVWPTLVRPADERPVDRGRRSASSPSWLRAAGSARRHARALRSLAALWVVLVVGATPTSPPGRCTGATSICIGTCGYMPDVGAMLAFVAQAVAGRRRRCRRRAAPAARLRAASAGHSAA